MIERRIWHVARGIAEDALEAELNTIDNRHLFEVHSIFQVGRGYTVVAVEYVPVEGSRSFIKNIGARIED